MPRFRVLNDVASGLLGSFMSRNNDIGGYWGLGMLRADHPGGTGVTQLFLVDRNALPATPSTASAVDSYAHWLRTKLDKRGFEASDVALANIVIEFRAAVPISAEPAVTYGDSVRCTVRIDDRHGHTYVASAAGQCAMHNPGRETRSARAVSE